MALHLGIAHARALERNRPRLDCSDHDVLMLFDSALDGLEDSDSDINQAMGMVNLAPVDWFAPFDSDRARDPARGLRHS
jgi:hypothetical protein